MSTARKDTKMRRMRDRGFSILETMAGIGLGAILMVGGVTVYATANQTSAKAAVLESQNSSLSNALDLISQNVVASNPIISAGTDELVVQSSDPQQNTIDTRWVHVGSTLYEQIWTGAAKGYPFGTSPVWLDPTKTASGVAPDGDGSQVTKVIATGLVPNASAAPVFAYFDKTAAAVDVSSAPVTAQNGATTAVRRVDIALAAQAGTGTVQNKTSASPRNTDGGAGNPSAVAAPVCPAVTLATSSAGNPLVQFATVVGSPNYLIYRNSGLATTVTPAAGTTQGSWEDTGANASPGQAISYTVLAQNTSGVTSPNSCRSATWRAAIPAPVFSPAQVLPATTLATDWTSGTANPAHLQKPRISLAWGAVPGASEYVLYFRQIDPATGQPMNADYKTAATMNASTLSFTWDDGGWGTEYAWKLVALAQSGSSAEADTTTLTHPPAPQNVKITPSYGTGSDTTVNGYNTITWDAVPAVTRYEVWRYSSGTSGAVTKIGTVAANASPLQYVDTVPYGTTYSYYVAAVNTGPRGGGSGDYSSPDPEANAQAATGAIPASASTAAWFGPSAMSGAGGLRSASVAAAHIALTATGSTATTNPGSSTPAPAVASQLQYPPIPSVNAVTTATSASTRDFDGYNQVTWQPATSAVGYYAQKEMPGQASANCLLASCTFGASGITGTSLTDPAGQGTQFLYSVIAYNATGVSVQYSAMVALTQRPAPPVLTMTAAPTLSTDNATFSLAQNADAGDAPSNFFCTSATCNYQLLRGGSAVTSVQHSQSGANWTPTWTNPDGATETYTAKSQNAAVTNGGWSDPSSAVTVNTYPGDFGYNAWLGNPSGNAKKRIDINTLNMAVAGPQLLQAPGWVTGAWGSSNGAVSFYTHRIAGNGEVTSTNPGYVLPAYPNATHTFSGGGGGTTADWAATGVNYWFDITATAANGLTRTHQTGPVMTPAETPRSSVLEVVCSGNTATSTTATTPSQLDAARMINFDPAVRMGNYANVEVDGYTYFQGQGPTRTNTVGIAWGSSGTAGAWNTINSGAGYGYYYGIRNEFDDMTKGTWSGPDSATVEFDIETYATFTSGCGAQGATWGGLAEPTNPCYGYVPGQPCNTPNLQNRPQWTNWGEN